MHSILYTTRVFRHCYRSTRPPSHANTHTDACGPILLDATPTHANAHGTTASPSTHENAYGIAVSIDAAANAIPAYANASLPDDEDASSPNDEDASLASPSICYDANACPSYENADENAE